MYEKSHQCKQFREKLIPSGMKKLVHNKESDTIWGFGEDGSGYDEMGKILMHPRNGSSIPSLAVASHYVDLAI